jgi:hypothetical protein
MVVTMRDFTPWGYSYESAWGTDPATSRLPFLGDVARMTVALDEQKEVRRSVGSGIDPKGFCRKARKIDANLVMNLADDNPDNSFLALALGSAPNASGVVTNYPSGSNRNLRSVSIEGGFDAAFDEFYLLKGCMVQSLDLIFEEGFVREEVKFVCKDLVRSSSRAVVAPTESTTSLFNPHDDVTMTWNGTPIPVVYEQRMKLSIQNKLSAKHTEGG